MGACSEETCVTVGEIEAHDPKDGMREASGAQSLSTISAQTRLAEEAALRGSWLVLAFAAASFNPRTSYTFGMRLDETPTLTWMSSTLSGSPGAYATAALHVIVCPAVDISARDSL
jgi:hypothetical protein